MSEIAGVPNKPPPPPPPLTASTENKKSGFVTLPKNVCNDSATLNNEINFERNKNEITSEVFRIFKPIDSILQDGPTCGMTALAMALPDHCKTYKDLCDIAINNNWSLMGEMYSCSWMEQLARMIGAKTRVISNGIQNHLECIAHCLRTGGSILVPYDKDKDFSPGLFEGVKAHWAIINGLLLFESPNKNNFSTSVKPCKCLDIPAVSKTNNYKLAECSPDIAIYLEEDGLRVSECLDSNATDVVAYVVSMQGLSHRLRIWPLLALAASNLNLRTEGDARKNQIVVPPEGVEKGLSGQAVMVWPN